MQPSIIIGVGGSSTMLEKLFLAVTITFSLNLFLQVQVPEKNNTDNNYRQQVETAPNIVVTLPKKYQVVGDQGD